MQRNNNILLRAADGTQDASLLLVRLPVVVLASGLLFAADHPDIVGTWTMDATHSDFGTHAAPDSMSLTFTKKGNLLRIAQTSKTPSDERMLETECKTDGRFHPVSGPVAGSVRCKWEGKTLIGEKELPDGSSKLIMRFTPGPDGRTATEQLHITGTGAGDSTIVWKR